MLRTQAKAMVLLTVLMANLAHASPITLHAGESAAWNFDLSYFTSPAPPYYEIYFEPNLQFFDAATDVGFWYFYSEAGLAGLPLFSFVSDTGYFPVSGTGFEDGIFSVSLSVTSGTFTVEPQALGVKVVGVYTPWVYGSLIGSTPGNTPEPNSLSVLVLGVLAMGMVRLWRKSKHWSSIDC